MFVAMVFHATDIVSWAWVAVAYEIQLSAAKNASHFIEFVSTVICTAIGDSWAWFAVT